MNIEKETSYNKIVIFGNDYLIDSTFIIQRISLPEILRSVYDISSVFSGIGFLITNKALEIAGYTRQGIGGGYGINQFQKIAPYNVYVRTVGIVLLFSVDFNFKQDNGVIRSGQRTGRGSLTEGDMEGAAENMVLFYKYACGTVHGKCFIHIVH